MKEIYFFNESNGKSYSLNITEDNFDKLINLFSEVEADEQPLDDDLVFSLCESYELISEEEANKIKKELDSFDNDICLN